MIVPWRRTAYRAGDVTLQCLEMGSGPLVVLLHGFPDSAHGWRFQLPALAGAGYRVIAPQLRGYAGSDKPAEVDDYRIAALVADVAGLVRAAGERRAAMIVGHDWGGMIAWHLGARHPDVMERLAICNAPHPTRFAEALRTPGQALRSAYVGFFQVPLLPELVLRAGDFALLRRSLARNVLRPGAFTDDDWAEVRAALAAPGALTAALSYYRAAGRRFVVRVPGSHEPSATSGVGEIPLVEPPTLLLWGEQDPFLSVSLTEGLAPLVRTLEVIRVAEAGHWVHWDAPERVNASLVAHLRRPSS